MLVGAGFDPNFYLEDPAYAALLNENFDFLTPIWGLTNENILRSQSMNLNHRVRFALDRAVSEGKSIYGHYLVSRSRPPAWVRKLDQMTPNLTSPLLEFVIAKLVGQYRGVISDWLVVNECFSQVGLIPSYWTRICGDNIIERAFIAAHKADPTATLWLSEFGIQNAKLWDVVYEYVTRMLDRGIPIHGIGAHIHTNLYPTRGRLEISGVASHLYPFHGVKINLLRKQIRRFKALGLKFHLSELTVWPGRKNVQRIINQGKTYSRYVEVGIEEGCDRISFWSILDDPQNPKLTWHWQGKRDYPGLWVRDNGRITPKPFTKNLLERAHGN